MPTRKPPPNYLARSFQLRMLSLVGALIIVWVLMSAARNPQNWTWFFRIGRGTTAARHVDTQYHPSNTAPPQALVRAGNETRPDTPPAEPEQATVDERAWSRVLADLDDLALAQLQQTLRAAGRNEANPLDPESRQRLLSDLDRAWSALSVSDLVPEEESAPAIDIDGLWAKWRPALEASIMSQPLDDQLHKLLAELDEILDRIACSRIRDNTAFRKIESMAWHRAIARMQASSADELKKISVGEVSFLQLFDQPTVYRCRIVTLSGYVRRIERVPARQPYLGISELFRLWIKPADGTDAPFVVYCIDLPKGLPRPSAEKPVITRDPPGEFVTVHGEFFKRWLYQGANRTAFLAPLLLTSHPIYQPPAEEVATEVSDPWKTIGWTALVAVIFAGAFTWYVWRMRPTEHQPASVQHLAELRSRRAAPGSEMAGGDSDDVPRIDA